MIPEGIHPDIPNDKYHADRQFLTSSKLQSFSKSPAQYSHQLEHPEPDTEATNCGTAFHLVMEFGASEYTGAYGRLLEGHGATKVVKESKAAIIAEGKIPLKPDVYDGIIKMRQSVEQHPAASQLLNAPGRAETTIATKDFETGVPIKCRPDLLTDSGIIVDWKSTIDASPTGFAKSVANFGYHRQAAFYLDCCKYAGVDVNRFLFVAVEKSAPYLVAVYELDEASIQLGRELNQRDLSQFAICQARNEWPGYSDNIEALHLPNWVFNQAKRGQDEY